MKIEFITEEDLYVLPLFEEFFRQYASEFEIVRVSCCRMMGNRRRLKLAQELTWLYGVSGFARLLGRFSVSSLLSRLPRHRNAQRHYSIGQLCAAYGIPYARIDNPNSDQFVQELKNRTADLVVSVACPYILKRPLLESPPKGCINLHNAPLPRYKGMMPTFWQMFHGEQKVGLTVHYMTEKIDDGKVLYQDEMDIRHGETLDQLIRRSKHRTAHCLAQVLRQLQNGTAQPVALGTENSSYYTFPNREQIREFRRRGLRAI
jgi:methionyl-tRNA formyltransferase